LTLNPSLFKNLINFLKKRKRVFLSVMLHWAKEKEEIILDCISAGRPVDNLDNII